MKGCSMTHGFTFARGATRLRAIVLALGALTAGACQNADVLGPTGDQVAVTPAPLADSAAAPSFLTGATAPGIAFASFDLPNSLLGTLHTGALRTPDQYTILTELSIARSKGARFVLKLAGGSDKWVKNADGTFNLDKWKAMVNRYRYININSYITDGTVLGHYLLDEPNLASRWGGKVIPQATVEAMAKYSKQIWPGMLTFIRVVPSWLKAAPITYTYLDAGWAQYAAYKGNPTTWLAAEVSAAKTKGLGLLVSMNVLDGGNGSSGIRGVSSGKWSMSATELRNYGGALLAQSYDCGFLMWMYNSTYFGRSDIKSAMSDLSTKARNHVKTSCRQ
jgi:hypothetical protein